MNTFHKALTKRWRIEAIREVCDQAPVTTFLARSTGPFGAPDLNHLREIQNVYHMGHCAFRNWADKGTGDLPSECEGKTGFEGTEMPVEDPQNPGSLVQVPPTITCPIKDLMPLVEDWAWAERDSIWAYLPKFDAHEQVKLKGAYDALEKLSQTFLLNGWQDVDMSQGDHHGLSGAEDLPGIVTKLWNKDADSRDWWVGWSGLAADRVRGNFLTSTGPTLINHYLIATALANLVSNRAAIVEHGRNNALYWIEQATAALDEVGERVVTDSTNLVPGWKVISGLGMTISLFGVGSGPAAPAIAATGGVFQLVGFLGENLIPEIKTWDFAQEVKAIVTDLSDRITSLNENLTTEEADYASSVTNTRSGLNEAGSFDLELYDLTENSATGTGGSGEGYEVVVSDVLTLAQYCESAAVAYEGTLAQFSDVLTADGHLADKDGSPTAADSDVVAMFNEFYEYVKTTSARYYLAHEQIKAAAESYAETDDGAKAVLERTMGDWEINGTGTAQPGFDTTAEAGDTDRPDGADDNPYDEGLNGDAYGTALNGEG
jgi:hypothetical protein